MQTVLLTGIVVSLLIYYAIWYWGHRGHRMIARGTKTISALDAVTASYRAGDYQTALQQAEGLKHGFSKTPEYCFFRGTMLHQLRKFSDAEASLREGLSLETEGAEPGPGQQCSGHRSDGSETLSRSHLVL